MLEGVIGLEEDEGVTEGEGDAEAVEMVVVSNGGIVVVQPEENTTKLITKSSKIEEFIVTLFLLFYSYLEN
jgi:predicted Fe-Mo cluster-binding NifX family protein